MSIKPLPPIMTLEQASEYLQISPDGLISELIAGRIPGLKIGGEWRIKKEVLDKLFESSSQTFIDSTASSDQLSPSTQIKDKTEDVGVQKQKHIDGKLNGESDSTLEAVESSIDSLTLVPLSPSTQIKDKTEDVGVQEQKHVDGKLHGESDSTLEAVESSIDTPTLVPPPKPGRVQARVFTYNPKQGYGHARLQDNRVVWMDLNYLITKSPRPFPGDIVEFELVRTKNGLEARSIQIVFKTNVQPKNESLTTQVRNQPVKNNPATSTIEKSSTLQPILQSNVSENKRDPRGSHESQLLFQKAAVAQTEGRIDDARRFFRKSIDAGGGTHVYEAYYKLENEKGQRSDAKRIIQQAIEIYPENVNFYVMYGHMERRARNYVQAEKIFRDGLSRFPTHTSLKAGLWQTLVQIGTETSFREAIEIFNSLDAKGKLNKNDILYQRFKALQKSPRANRAYDFFQSANFRVGIARRRDLPSHITDIVAEINNQELSESFGLSGAILVRCFQKPPNQIDIVNLSKYLKAMGAQGVLGLQDREVVINTTLAFIAVPSSDSVRDQVMSILSENNEAIVPIDDENIKNGDDPLKTIRDLLGQYLGLRNLYSSTHPVSGRRFFGREKLLLQLTDEVQHGQFLGIYGLRKTGKTSLIYQLRDEKLRGEAVAYMDLQASAALTLRNCDPLYWELERDLYLRLREGNSTAADLLTLGKIERFSVLQEKVSNIALTFSEDISSFLDAISNNQIPSVKHLVIVLDELERILPVGDQVGISGYLEFFGLLRGFSQTERYRGLLSSVVVAANAAISEKGYWEGRENPVFALYKSIPLPPLSEKECEVMIRTLGKGMSVYWKDDAIKAIFDETGGHPFLTRALCSRITQQYPTRPLSVDKALVIDQVLPFVRDEGDKLEQITELLRRNFPEEEELLEKIALEETNIKHEDYLMKHLIDYHLVKTDKDFSKLTLNLLKRWLRRRAGIKE